MAQESDENLAMLPNNYNQELNSSLESYKKSESRKTSWLIPFFHLLTCRLCTWGYSLSDVNTEGWSECQKYACFLLIGLLSILGVIFQVLIFLVYLLDMLYRPVLFLVTLTEFKFNDSNPHSNSPSDRLYHEYENYFIFAWDYIYGLIGLFSTFFLFWYSWVKTSDSKTIAKLFEDIIRNKVSVYKYKLKVYGLRNDNFSFRKFLLSCELESTFLNKFGWSLVNILVIVLSVLLVVYWIIVNAYVWMTNEVSYRPFTQDSDLLFILMIFDCIYWHLAPVLVCFLIRASCIELTTKLQKLIYKFAWTCLPLSNATATNSIFIPQEMVPLVNSQENQNADGAFVNENLEANQAERSALRSFELWSEYYSVLRKVSDVANKFNWIAAINSIGLIFGVVGLSVMYIMKSQTTINDFFQNDVIDAIRLITWYIINLISVWLMMNSMAALNTKLDNFSDEILMILAEKRIILNRTIKKELSVCSKSHQKFTLTLFGTITPSTSNAILASGGTTLCIFLTYGIKLVINNFK